MNESKRARGEIAKACCISELPYFQKELIGQMRMMLKNSTRACFPSFSLLTYLSLSYTRPGSS